MCEVWRGRVGWGRETLVLSLIAAGSLLLFLATGGMWVRSYWACDRIRWNSPPKATGAPYERTSTEWEVVTRTANVQFYRAVHVSRRDDYWMFAPKPGFKLTSDGPDESSVYLTTPIGFGFTREQWTTEAMNRDVIVVFPWWSLLLTSGAIPVLFFIRNFRRRPKGCCSGCGYSLTGNTSGTCPECGTPIPQSSGPA